MQPLKHGRGVGRSAPLGGAVFYCNNPRDLFDRLHLLGGSIIAGNDSVKNEFSEVPHTLHKFGAFPSEVLNSLLTKFLTI